MYRKTGTGTLPDAQMPDTGEQERVMSYTWNQLGLRIPEIMLPKEGADYGKWAVVACDQYTSDPAYWQKAEEIVGGAPSTLRLMLPEFYLGKPDEEKRIVDIRSAMKAYVEQGTLRTLPKGCMLVRRTAEGRSRLGLVICVDLDAFDYRVGASSLIRSTEKTIVERIPPRLKIRKGAMLELPHILILIDDPDKSVIEPLEKAGGEVVYDTDLMLGGGHITGTFLSEEKMEGAREAMSALFDKAEQTYGTGKAMLMAMGDGNHSLATAKANWEEIKQQIPEEERSSHPARYALCELENIHDEGIVFEPIHRVLFADGKASGAQIIEETAAVLKEQSKDCQIAPKGTAAGEDQFAIPVICADGEKVLLIDRPSSKIEVGALQNALDLLVQEKGYRIDYIHGEDAVRSLAAEEGNAGFLLPPMDKFLLFPAVASDGALPRKTFSMGEAVEKRYYIEARSLV